MSRDDSQKIKEIADILAYDRSKIMRVLDDMKLWVVRGHRPDAKHIKQWHAGLRAAIRQPAPLAAEVTEADVLALVPGVHNYHHKMNDLQEAAANAFNHCRSMTSQNIKTFFEMRELLHRSRGQG